MSREGTQIRVISSYIQNDHKERRRVYAQLLEDNALAFAGRSETKQTRDSLT